MDGPELLKTNPKPQKSAATIGLRSFISVVVIMLVIIIAVGILTYIVPAGAFDLDGDGSIISGSFRYIESKTRLHPLRWLTAPFEVLFSSDGGVVILISALLLILGGAFGVMEKSGGIKALMTVLIKKFANAKYKLIWAVVLFFMLFAALFGIFEEGLILLPLVLILTSAMGWDKMTGLSMCLLSLGAGFGVAITNPFTIGIAARLTSTSVLTGLWFRAIAFVILWVLTSLFVTMLAKKSERKKKGTDFAVDEQALKEFSEINAETKRNAKIYGLFFAVILGIMIISSVINALGWGDFILISMAGGFFVGSLLCGSLAVGSFKKAAKFFLQGMLAVAPAILILLMASSIKYIADKGNILHTAINYFSSSLSGISPYAAIIAVYVIIMIFDFFISSGSAKVLLLIPFLASLQLPGISIELIILAYVLGDGFTNIFYPTNAMLLVGLGLADTDYIKWFKTTWWFQLLLIAFSVAILSLGVLIGY